MKPKKEMIPGLTLSQNFRLVMTEEGLTFKDLAQKARVSQATCYRLVERNPVFVTDQLVKFGKSLGFTEKQIREKSRQDRLASKVTYSKKERLYQLVAKIIDLFDSK
jgi:predicted transcriptional regulator